MILLQLKNLMELIIKRREYFPIPGSYLVAIS